MRTSLLVNGMDRLELARFRLSASHDIYQRVTSAWIGARQWS
jgi:hypothetical protein